MTMTMRVMVVAVAALAAGSARAAEACRADIEKLCAGIPPGGGRLSACLKANAAKVSPECKAELATVRRKVQEVGEACRDDIASYCADVQPGGGRVLRCLGDSLWSLSPGCQEIVKGAREKAAEFQKACAKDAKTLCKGIRPGQGRILACLESRKADLTPTCQALMSAPPPAPAPAPTPPAQ